MSFLAPLLLAGLAALAIPLLIHLIHRERKQVVEFPSLMFLRQIPYRSIRRQKIRHWPLLLMRLAALLLIVLAFARPFLWRASATTGGTAGAREVVILVDRSYSMGYDDRWNLARRAAHHAIDALSADDRATLISFANGAQTLVQSSTERTRLGGAIDSLEVGTGVTRYGPVLKLAQSVLEQSDLPRQEVILISDFQKAGWNPVDVARLPEGATLTPVVVSDQETSNVVVSTVSLERDEFAGRERVAVSARLTNRSIRPVEALEVVLEVDGAEVQAERVNLDAQGSTGVTFTPLPLGEPHTRVTVRTTPDALPADNEFHVGLSPRTPIRVLLLESPRARRTSTLYVRNALAIGTAPSFAIDVASVTAVGPDDFTDRAVVILNDAPPPTGAAGRRLAEFVSGGGGLLVALGEQAAWTADSPDVLPGTFEAPVDHAGRRGGTFGFIDYSHEVFELFSAPRSGDLTGVRVFRSRPATVENPSRVLARFDDGAIALAERRVGQGRVLMWTSTLDSFWNDLALAPVFLPFIHSMTEYLAGYVAPMPWFEAGQVLQLDRGTLASGSVLGPSAALSLEGERIALTPSGRRLALDGEGESEFLELGEQGFYEIRARGAETERPVVVAVNLDLTESDLTPLDLAEVVGAVTGRAGGDRAVTSAETTELSPEEQERRQGVWWYLLVAAILLLAAETVFGNRLSRASTGALVGLTTGGSTPTASSRDRPHAFR